MRPSIQHRNSGNFGAYVGRSRMQCTIAILVNNLRDGKHDNVDYNISMGFESLFEQSVQMRK